MTGNLNSDTYGYGSTQPSSYSSWQYGSGLKITWNYEAGGGRSTFFNGGGLGVGGYDWYNTYSSSTTLQKLMKLDYTGQLLPNYITLLNAPVNQSLNYVMCSSGNNGTLSYAEFQIHQLYTSITSIFPSTMFINAFVKYQNSSSFLFWVVSRSFYCVVGTATPFGIPRRLFGGSFADALCRSAFSPPQPDQPRKTLSKAQSRASQPRFRSVSKARQVDRMKLKRAGSESVSLRSRSLRSGVRLAGRWLASRAKTPLLPKRDTPTHCKPRRSNGELSPKKGRHQPYH